MQCAVCSKENGKSQQFFPLAEMEKNLPSMSRSIYRAVRDSLVIYITYISLIEITGLQLIVDLLDKLVIYTLVKVLSNTLNIVWK